MEDTTIYVVDDSPHNLSVLFDQLEAAGYRILVGTSGESALQIIPKIMPDLILLDVMMPGLDGYAVCRRLKANERTQSIPIIFISALDEVFNKVLAFKVGGVDYITKPFEFEEVLARVQTHLTLRRLQQTLEDRNSQLESALARVKLLRGLLPICANCKKIRNDEGYWIQVEQYIRMHSDADFTHGICPDCFEVLYSEFSEGKPDHEKNDD